MLKLTEQNRKWWILAAMTSSISMIFIDITVLPVALPTIQRTLGLSEFGLQWIVNAYTLSLTIFLLAGGRFSDRIGHRNGFCLGLVLFAGASALCGLSFAQWWFIFARILQGIGGGILIPSSSAIIYNSFPPQQRGKALGLYVSIGAIFLAAGPMIGGLFTEYLSWRLVFWINLPIACLGFFLTIFCVPQREGTHKPFDLMGFFTFSLGISAIVIALMQSKQWGWLSFWTIGFLVMGCVLLFFLWKIDREVEDPYIDFTLFHNTTFVGSISSIFCTQFLVMVTVFWAIYFQNALGFNPAQAGLLSLLANAPVMIAAPLGGYLLDKFGPRLPIMIGFFLIASSLIWFTQNIETKNIWRLLSAIIPFGFGIPFIYTPSFATALGEIEPTRRGLASGTVGMLRQLGGTMGLAVIGSLFLNVQFGVFASNLKHSTDTANLNPLEFQGLLSGTPEAKENLQKLSELMQAFVKQSYLNSFVDAFWWINSAAIIVALIGLVLALSLIKKKKKQE